MINGYRHNIDQMQALKRRYGGQLVEKAFGFALDGTQRKAASHISRDIRSTYSIQVAQVKRSLQIQRARRDARRALIYTGRRIPLGQFKPNSRRVRTVATSVRGKKFRTHRRIGTVMVKRGRRIVTPHGWNAKGHILRRADRDDPQSQPRIQFGPSIPGMVSHQSVIDSAQAMVREDLPRQFSGRLDYLLSRQGGARGR